MGLAIHATGPAPLGLTAWASESDSATLTTAVRTHPSKLVHLLWIEKLTAFQHAPGILKLRKKVLQFTEYFRFMNYFEMFFKSVTILTTPVILTLVQKFWKKNCLSPYSNTRSTLNLWTFKQKIIWELLGNTRWNISKFMDFLDVSCCNPSWYAYEKCIQK